MIRTNDILQKGESLATLPYFTSIPGATSPARSDIDGTLAVMDDLCRRQVTKMTKFIKGQIQMARDDARQRFGPASNDECATPHST